MIAFSAQRAYTDNWEIYVLNDDGSSPRRLIGSRYHECTRPIWSPDGTRLAFLSTRRGLRMNTRSYLINANSSGLRALTVQDAYNQVAAWLPDGRLVIYFYHTGYDVCLINADGTGLRHLINSDTYAYAALSPDGQRLVLTRHSDEGALYSADVDTLDICLLSATTPPRVHPVWSPNGSHIACITNYADHDALTVMDADGSNIRELGEIALHGDFVWSPDSRALAYIGYGEWRYAIYIAHADGSQHYHLTDLNSGDGGGTLRPATPCWSPDSRSLAFSTCLEAGFYIYRIDVHGNECQRLTGDAGPFGLIYDLAWGRQEEKP
jgi:Tol biopolymer transport system component